MPLDDVSRVKNRIMQITHLKIRLKMVFAKDDLAVIVTCFTKKKGWTGTRIAKEFPNTKWNNYWGISQVLTKYRNTGTTDCNKKGSGRPVTVITDENLAEVEQLCQSQDDKPGPHNSQRQAARITGVSRRSVQRMLKRRGIHPFNRMQTSTVNVLWLTKPFNFSQIFHHFLLPAALRAEQAAGI